jgi:transcriptional regulator with XRE-family HTH domain
MKKHDGTIVGSEAAIEQEIRVEIGGRIAELRRKRKLSARLVADKLGISREAITHIENGRNNITAITLWKLATLFHCNVQDFFPSVPDGFELTSVDAEKIAQEGGQRAAKWAAKLFGEKS